MNYIAGPNQLLTSQSTPGGSSTNTPKTNIITNNIRNNKDSTLNNIRNNIHSATTNPIRSNNNAKATTTNIVRNKGISTTTNSNRNKNTTKDVTHNNINRNKQLLGLNAINNSPVTSIPNTEAPSFTNIINPLFPRPNLNPKINHLFPNRQSTNLVNQKQISSSSSSSSSNNAKTISSFNNGAVNTWHDLIIRSQSQQKQQNSSLSQEKHFVKSFAQFPSKNLPKTLSNIPTKSIHPNNNNQIRNIVNASPTTSTTINSGKGRQLISQINPPVPSSATVLRRPFTPITRPRSRIVQTPASEEYIKSFPEVAAPEGFPDGVKDPEEETIRNNIIELQRIN